MGVLMGWEFIASGLLATIIRIILIIYGICLVVSFAIIFLLTRKIKGRKKWILRFVLPFPLAFLLLLLIGFIGRIISSG